MTTCSGISSCASEPARAPATELAALYHERWELELGYDEVKTELLDREETIRSRSPEAVAQELFGILLAYNLVRLEAQGLADEIGAVDERGQVLFGDQLLVLYGRDLVERVGPGQEVIYDVKCSDAVAEALTAAGARPTMWMTGHSNIKKRMKETGAPLAGEMSGHMFFGPPDYLGFDDALYAAARLLKIVAATPDPISRRLADVPRYVSTPEIRVDCAEDRKVPVVRAASAFFAGRSETITIDGVRWRTPDGWGLIRASNTQPILVMRFEARTAEGLVRIQAEAQRALAGEGVRIETS